MIHQPSYNMINRWVERDGLKATLEELGIGSIAFTPLAQGMLTGEVPERHPRGQPRHPGVAQPRHAQRAPSSISAR